MKIPELKPDKHSEFLESCSNKEKSLVVICYLFECLPINLITAEAFPTSSSGLDRSGYILKHFGLNTSKYPETSEFCGIFKGHKVSKVKEVLQNDPQDFSEIIKLLAYAPMHPRYNAESNTIDHLEPEFDSEADSFMTPALAWIFILAFVMFLASFT